MFEIDSPIFLGLKARRKAARKTEQSRNRSNGWNAGRCQNSASSTVFDPSPLLNTFVYELVLRYGPSILALDPTSSPPDSLVLSALQAQENKHLHSSTVASNRFFPATTSRSSSVRDSSTGEFTYFLLLLLAFYLEKRERLAA